jgi:cell division protein FtsQ
MSRKKGKIQKTRRRLISQKPGLGHKRLIKLSAGLLVLLCFFAFLRYTWISFSHQPIRRVDISSDGRAVSVNKLRPLVDRFVTRDFYTLNTHELQLRLSLIPWVKSASIRRVWPDKLSVVIHERKAFALWNETQLLSADGVLFQPPITTYPPNLPQLSGGEGDEKKVLEEYLILTKEMGFLGLRVLALNLVGSSCNFLLDSKTKVYFNQGDKQQLARFNKLFQQVLRGKLQRVERVDLRYPGGASVRWKEGSEEKYEH